MSTPDIMVESNPVRATSQLIPTTRTVRRYGNLGSNAELEFGHWIDRITRPHAAGIQDP
jgi:hypothetical protein